MAERILVVDDDDELRGCVAEMLSEEGYDVDQAVDGVDALSTIVERRPDAILVDYFMPRMDGRELVHSLRGRKDTSNIPVLVMSAVDALYSARELSINESDMVAKPIVAEVLLGKVALALYRAREEATGPRDLDVQARLLEEDVAEDATKFTVIAVDSTRDLQRKLDDELGDSGVVIGVATADQQLLRLVRTLAPDVVAIAARSDVGCAIECARLIKEQSASRVVIGAPEPDLAKTQAAVAELGATAVEIEGLVARVTSRRAAR